MEWTLGALAKILAEFGKPALKRTIGDSPLLVFDKQGTAADLFNTPVAGTYLQTTRVGRLDSDSCSTKTERIDEFDPWAGLTRAESLVLSLSKSNRNPFADLITVGRAHNNDVRLAATQVSKIHCFLLSRPEGWVVRDNGSTNGTFLNTVQLEPKVDHRLEPGDELRFAGVSSRFVDAEALSALLAFLAPA